MRTIPAFGVLALAASALAGSIAVATVHPASGDQVDREWLRTWTETQSVKPATLVANSRIAPDSEPGPPLVIDGRVVEPDGRTPARGVVVFAYQTDRDGLYFGPGGANGPWRLRGWARTDDDGRFTFSTIRPAPYPGRDVPAHVHFTFETERFGRQWTRELWFDDDPLVTADARRQSAAEAPYGRVHALRVIEGVPHVTFETRLKSRGDF
jgi:protocatechuate 3,4-dioxygenase beta subunit